MACAHSAAGALAVTARSAAAARIAASTRPAAATARATSARMKMKTSSPPRHRRNSRMKAQSPALRQRQVKFFQENFMTSIFTGNSRRKLCAVRPCLGGNQDMYHQHLAERSKKDGGWPLVVGRWPKPRQPVDQRLTTKDQRATANDGCSLMALPETRIRRLPQPQRLCRRHRRLALLCLCSAHGCFR